MFVCMRERDRHPGGRQTKPLGAILSKNFVKGWQGSESERCSNAHEGEESKCTISHFFLVSQLFFPLCTRAFFFFLTFSEPSVQFSSVAQSCPTFCDPMDCSMPGLPAHHQLPEFTQTHVHRVSDAIQPSHPLSSPSPPAPNPSQHQGLFQWVNSSHEVAKVLEFQFYHHFFQRTSRTDLL